MASHCTHVPLLASYRFNFSCSTSPSAYVAYQSLEAYSGNCGPFNYVVQGQKNFTIGYLPSALSTYEGNLDDWIAEGSMGFPPVSAINYTQLQYLSSTEGIYLSLPDGLNSLDPAFSTCGNLDIAVGDPPRILGPATAMVPSATAAAPYLAASPGAQVGPALAPSTPMPALKESDFKLPPLVAPVDPQESTSQDSNPQNAGSGSPGDPPLDEPDIAADPNSSPDLSVDMDNSEGYGAVAGSGEGVAEQSGDNNAGSLSAGAELEQESDPGFPTNGVTANNDDHSIASINGQQVQAAPGGGVVIGTLTVRPGYQMTQDGTTLSIGTMSLVIDGTAYALPTSIETEPLIVNGQTIAKDSNGGVVIGAATYSPGTKTSIPGISLSVGANNVVINGATYTLPGYPDPSPASASSQIVMGGQWIRRAADGGLWVGSSSIAAGGQATISGHAISVASSSIVVDKIAFPLVAAPLPTDSLLVGGESVGRAADGGVWIGSSSIAAGSQAIVSGHVIFVDASSVIVDGTAFPLLPSTAPALPTTTTNAILIDGTSIRRGRDGSVIINGSSTLPLGSLVTFAGNIIISVGASSVMVDGTSYPLPTAAGAEVLQQQQGDNGSNNNNADIQVLTLANGDVVTIPTVSGGATTISGTTYSIIPPAGGDEGKSGGGELVVINGKTAQLPTARSTPTITGTNPGGEATAIGGLIMSGFSNGSSGAVVEYTGGGAVARRRRRGCVLVFLGVEIAVVMMMMMMGGAL